MSETEHPHQSPAVVEFDALLAPVPGDSPTGADLRADDSPVSPYYKIKDARNAARAAERAAIMDPAAEPADWQPVLKQAPMLLAEKAKDLEIVAWYIEALVRTHGMAGLRDGFRLARQLCETYWDKLFPSIETEGVEGRVAPLTGLNGDDSEGTLIGPIRNVSVTGGSSVGPFSVWQYEQALEVDKIADQEAKQRRIDAGAIAMKDVLTAVKETSAGQFRTLRDDLAAAREEFAKLCTVLDEKAGSASPPASNIRAALEKFGDTFAFVTAGLILDESAAAVQGGEGAAADAGGAGARAGGGGAATGDPNVIRTREDAFRTLERVADFFRQTEPHSPLAYALNQAVRWGRMPLPDLLTELIPDEAARTSFFRITGIQPPAGGG